MQLFTIVLVVLLKLKSPKKVNSIKTIGMEAGQNLWQMEVISRNIVVFSSKAYWKMKTHF